MPEVLKTQASEGKGTEEVAELIQKHRSFLETTGKLERNRKLRLERRIREIIEDQLHIEFWNSERSRELHQRLDLLLQRQSNPYDVAAGLMEDFRTSGRQQ